MTSAYRPSHFQTPQHDEFARLDAQATCNFEDELVALRSVGMPELGKLLDVGCGTGRFAQQLSERRIGEVHGIDADHAAVCEAVKRLEFAELRGASNLEPLRGQYAGSYSRLVLRHIVSPEWFLKEQAMVVGSGSWVGAIEAIDSSLLLHPQPITIDSVMAARRAFFSARGADGDIGAYLKTTLRKAGLAKVKVVPLLLTTEHVGVETFCDVVLDPFVRAASVAGMSQSDVEITAFSFKEFRKMPNAFGSIMFVVAGGFVP